MAVLLLIVLLFCTWLYSSIWKYMVKGRINISIELPQEVVDCDDLVTIRCRFQNHSSMPCPHANWRIQLPSQLSSQREEDPHFVDINVFLPRRMETVIEVQVRAVKRGLARINAASVLLTEGFGIRRIVRSLAVHGMIVVRPRRVSIIPMTPHMLDLVGDVRVQRFYQDDPSLFIGVRPYEPGDSLRRISWTHSARTVDLMTKQFGYTSTANCLIVLAGNDTFLFDHLCERVVKIAEKLLHAGIPTGLLTNRLDTISRDFLAEPSADPSQLERIRMRMGTVDDVPVVSFASLLRSVPRVTEPNDMVVLVTDGLRTEDTVEVIRLLHTRRNLVSYVFAESPDEVPYIHGVRTYAEGSVKLV